jgi:hypothetical protein
VSLLVTLLLIAEGVVAAPIRIDDQNGHARSVPGAKPTLVIYEDQDGGKENTHAKDVLGKINTKLENQARVDVLAVADLEKWNWWPAKKYALADIQKTAKEKRTTVYLDWTGAVRKAWGLQPRHSYLILVAPDGRVLFSSQGDLSPARLSELIARLQTFGVVP